MLLVIIVIVIILCIFSLLIEFPELCGLLFMGFVGCIIGVIYLSSGIIEGRIIDSKIQMYNEENINIENKVKETVRSYMNFEENTYKELVEKAELTTLVIKYPELNSNELIKTEINLYIENNNKIKQLKEEKLDITIKKWWLYFGK